MKSKILHTQGLIIILTAIFIILHAGRAFAQNKGKENNAIKNSAKVESQESELSKLDKFTDYVIYKYEKSSVNQNSQKLGMKRVDSNSQKNPVKMNITRPDKGTLCYLATNFENPQSKQKRISAVNALIFKGLFDQALRLENSAPEEPTNLWIRSFNSKDDLVGRTEVFHFEGDAKNVWGTPRLSPDGKKVALLYKNYEDSPVSHSDLLIVDREKGQLQRVKCGDGIDYDQAKWSPDSQFLALFVGGLNNGDVETSLGSEQIHIPLELWIYDVNANSVSQVVKNDTTRGPVAWAPPHKLLYGIVPKNAEAQVGLEQQKLVQPSIWSYAPETKKSSLFLKDAYLPTMSADGRKIAFFGPEDTTQPIPLAEGWRFAPQGLSLSTANSDGSQRRPLNLTQGLYPQLY